MTDYRVTFMERGRAQLVAHPFDDIPAPNQIVGQNVLSLISTGSERGGFTQEFSAESYPTETGSSSIARVLRVGGAVTAFQPGDFFFHNEHHTRYVKVKEDDAIAVPRQSELEKIIFGRYAAVSMTSIYHMKAKAADAVIVTGQGLVGVMCAAVLQVFGFTVYAVDPSPERRAAAQAAGILHVGESLETMGVSLTSCSAQMECCGNENALRSSLPYLRKGGEIFQIGVPWHKCSEWDAHSLLYEIFYAYVSIQGGWEWSVPVKSDDFHAHSSYSHIRTAMELISAGKIKIPQAMYELRDPWDCNAVYTEISLPQMCPTSKLLDWRNFEEEV